MFDKAKAWAKMHDDEVKMLIKCGALIIGAFVIYNASFDYGYNARVNIEKSAGEGLYEAIRSYSGD